MKPDDVSKGRGSSRTKNPKRTQGKTISTKTDKTDDELTVQELESTDDEGEQRLEEEKMEEDEREKSGAPQRTGRVVVVKPKESRSSILKRKAESQTEADEHEEEYPEDVRI